MRSAPLVLLALAALPSACGGATAVSPAMLDAAKKRWPDASVESLERGRATFSKRCRECHRLPQPASHTSQEWTKILGKMSKLAKLDPEQKDDVLRYLVAAREARQ